MSSNVFGDLFDFRPGTKRKPEAPPQPDPEIDYGKGRVLNLKGQMVEFFLIGALASALNRAAVTIRSWEVAGRLPLSQYRTEAPVISPLEDKTAMGRRLYTRAQIDAVVTAAKVTGVFENKPDADWDKFTKLVIDGWKKCKL